jgi:renalase
VGLVDPVVVVGAGISGTACAREVVAAGLPVRVLDRGRAVGGRMASRELHGRQVDLGASYLTASDPAFTAVVDDWVARGLARPWTTRIATLGPDGRGEDKEGPQRWGAPGGLRSLVVDLAAGLDVESEVTVQRIGRSAGGPLVDGAPASAVVLAMPDPQAARLLDPPLRALATRLDRPWEPVLALAAGWPERTWGDLRAAFVDDPDVAFVADDGDRRGDGAPVLVVHSTSALAARHLDHPDAAAEPLLAAARRLLDLPAPLWHRVHRWTFARPAGTREELFALDDGGPDDGGPVDGGPVGQGLVGVCGDGWATRSKVEAAYLSGRALGRELVRRLS